LFDGENISFDASFVIYINSTNISPIMIINSTGLLISPSGTSELDCATTKKDRAERSISIGTESLKVFFLY